MPDSETMELLQQLRLCYSQQMPMLFLIDSFLSTFSYLFCPGGADPDGFWFSVSCVSPPPVHDGCWPPGWLPPPFVQEVSVPEILASAGVATNTEATAAITAMVASVENVNVFLVNIISKLRQQYKTFS
jgi:hypothetical protein